MFYFHCQSNNRHSHTENWHQNHLCFNFNAVCSLFHLIMRQWHKQNDETVQRHCANFGLCSFKTRHMKGLQWPRYQPRMCVRVLCVCNWLIGLHVSSPGAFIQVGGRLEENVKKQTYDLWLSNHEFLMNQKTIKKNVLLRRSIAYGNDRINLYFYY